MVFSINLLCKAERTIINDKTKKAAFFIIITALSCWVIVYSDQLLSGMPTSSWCSPYTHISYHNISLNQSNFFFPGYHMYQYNSTHHTGKETDLVTTLNKNLSPCSFEIPSSYHYKCFKGLLVPKFLILDFKIKFFI